MIPQRDGPTLFTETGRLDPFNAIEGYFALVRQKFPDVFRTGARFYFYQYDDATLTLNGLYDAATGEKLDRKDDYEYGWDFPHYLNQTVHKQGYKPVEPPHLVAFLRAYWSLTIRRQQVTLTGISQDQLVYHCLLIGGALGAMTPGLKLASIEDWS